MQMVLGSKAIRMQTTFLKSLLLHHFEGSKEAEPAPIHLHLLTDRATRAILEGLIGSWQISDLRVTFYSAEPIQVGNFFNSELEGSNFKEKLIKWH